MVACNAFEPNGLNDQRLAESLLWCKAIATLDAVRLIQAGARAGLVCQLTGIDKKAANRLYRQIHDRPRRPVKRPLRMRGS